MTPELWWTLFCYFELITMPALLIFIFCYGSGMILLKLYRMWRDRNKPKPVRTLMREEEMEPETPPPAPDPDFTDIVEMLKYLKVPAKRAEQCASMAGREGTLDDRLKRAIAIARGHKP